MTHKEAVDQLIVMIKIVVAVEFFVTVGIVCIVVKMLRDNSAINRSTNMTRKARDKRK